MQITVLLILRQVTQSLRETRGCRPKPRVFYVARYLLRGLGGDAELERNLMPNNSIYLESGLWRREQSRERDPFRVFRELFNANATGRGVATENAGVVPEFEVAETTEEFLLSARVPGITPAELQVRVTAQLVIVLRKQAPPTDSATAGEPQVSLPHAAFRRAFVLPTAVDARRLKVAIAGDLLTIRLPKCAPALSHRVTSTQR